MATISYISQSQLDTIRAKVATDVLDTTKEERKRLKELSEARAEQWPNTLQAQRARKERARQERMAAEEAERVDTDRREAELRAESRRVQIERANKVLFDETDRVKGFHSKMLLSDVMKENEEQLEHKKVVEVLRRAQEAAFVEQQRQALEAAEAAELLKLEAARQRALDQKDVQMSQLEDLKFRILSQRAEDKKEGQLLKQRAAEEAEEMRLKELARLEKGKLLTFETTRANETLQAFKLQELRRAQEQEAAIEAYSRKKDEMTLARQQRLAEKQAAKDAERQKIADAMAANYREWHNKEETLLARDVAQADAKAAADEAARKQYIKDTHIGLDKSRQAQLLAKAEAKRKAKEEETEFKDAWATRTRELKQEETAEQRERLARGKQLESFQLRQAQLKARKAAQAKIEELQEAAQMQLSLAEQEDIFQQYAAACIDEYRRQGKSTVPMELHLRKKGDF